LLNYNRTVLNLPKTTVVTAWTGPDRLKPIVQAGYPALLNGGWYLDYESQPWSAYYSNEPFAGNLTDAEKKLVIGGEASMWAERVDDIVFDERVFPRSFGTAERLWSSQNVNIVDDITEDRMDQHRCNFVRRGVGAGPIRPSYCEAVYVPYKYSWQK
jgi:hexosaminidase